MADLSGSNLEGSNLSEVDLSCTNLNRVNLSRANLTSAVLSGADLRSAYLFEDDEEDKPSCAEMSGVIYDLETKWPQGFDPVSVGAVLKTSRDGIQRLINTEIKDLSGLDLRTSCLGEMDLCSVDFSRANLSRANLNGSNLVDANLEGANLRGQV
jgi:uncharacterized protein YjbI with pentapeptide repeats